MTVMIRVLTLALMLLLVQDELDSQTKSTPRGSDAIALGSSTLTLGMSEERVVKLLRSEYELRNHWQAGPSSGWQVCDKVNKKDEPCEARVSFEDGKLAEAVRPWRQDGTPADLAKFLNALVARFVADGNTSCRLDTVNVRDQFSTDESSLILCNHNRYELGSSLLRQVQSRMYSRFCRRSQRCDRVAGAFFQGCHPERSGWFAKRSSHGVEGPR